jgi:hypothetical protein
MRPEEIVGLIENVANRPDIRETQKRQVEEIYKMRLEAEQRGWDRAIDAAKNVLNGGIVFQCARAKVSELKSSFHTLVEHHSGEKQ